MGAHSLACYSLAAASVVELLLTCAFLLLALGFTLTLIHLTSVPVTNTSVNRARSPRRS